MSKKLKNVHWVPAVTGATRTAIVSGSAENSRTRTGRCPGVEVGMSTNRRRNECAFIQIKKTFGRNSRDPLESTI